jgi:hypothetical protein
MIIGILKLLILTFCLTVLHTKWVNHNLTIKNPIDTIGNRSRDLSTSTTAPPIDNTGRFVMFSVITNIYNKKTKGPTVHTSNTSSCKNKLFQFSCGCEQFHYRRSFGFLVMNICNHGEHYEIAPYNTAHANFMLDNEG